MADATPYEVEFDRQAAVTYDGQAYRFTRGDVFTPENQDPCWILRFLDAVVAQNERLGIAGDPESWTTMRELRARCEPGGQGLDVASPAVPRPVEDPSATGVDRRPPADEPSSEELNAPQPETIGRVRGTQAGPATDPQRSLGQQYHAPRNPVSDDDIADDFAGRGLGPRDVSQALLDARRNTAPPGHPHPDHSARVSPNQPVSKDPVLLFTGQFALDLVDVSIPTRGLALALRRVYRSGPVSHGPLGYNWDHAYHCYLRPLDNGAVAVWTGDLHEDVFTRRPDAPGLPGPPQFEPPPGVFELLEYHPASPTRDEAYQLTAAGGIVQTFARPDGWPRPDRLPLTAIDDGRGNVQRLTYDPEGRLTRVMDDDGRFLAFEYDQDLLARVVDQTGRTWSYHYDDEHLVAVTTPSTPQFPEGITNRYLYQIDHPHPALRHAMVAMANGLGETLVENEYGSDPDSLDWNRVVRQVFGGYENTFAYTALQYVPDEGDVINVPAVRVEVVDPGILRVYTFNSRGDLLDLRHRLMLDGTYRLHAEVFRYDAHGNLIEYRGPDGLGVRRLYDETNPDPRARGNLLREWLLAPPATGLAAREVLRATYEPRHHLIKRVTDEGGATTTFVYDYEETPVDRGEVIRIEHPLATLPDGSVQEAAERFTFDVRGQLIEYRTAAGHLHQYAYFQDGVRAGQLRKVVSDAAGAAVVDLYDYDPWGRLAAVTDGRGHITHYEHDALGNLERIVLPAVNGVRDDIRFGYRPDGRLAWQRSSRGTYDDVTLRGGAILDTFDYDALGHPKEVVYSANTAAPRRWTMRHAPEGWPLQIRDPIGRTTWYRYDERGCVLEERLTQEGIANGHPRVWTRTYDRGGRLAHDTDPADVTEVFRYDAWGRLDRITTPGADPAAPTVTTFKHGTRDELTGLQVTGPPGPGEAPRTLARIECDYDERGRLVRLTQGGETTTIWHDEDDRPVRREGARGLVEEAEYDGHGQVTLWRDAAGNELHLGYDAAGNLERSESHEVELDGAAPSVFASAVRYDARNRPIETEDPLGNVHRFEWDARDELVAVIDPLAHRAEVTFELGGARTALRTRLADGTLVEWRWERDAVGRPTVVTDPEGHQTRYTWDLEDHALRVTLPDGSEVRQRTDPAGRVQALEAPGGTIVRYTYGADGRIARVDFHGGPHVVPVAPLELMYDGLGRLVVLAQGALRLVRRYDERDRVLVEALDGRAVEVRYDDATGDVELVYPDGRIDLYEHDRLDRVVAIRLVRAGIGNLRGTPPAGSVLARLEYAGPSRLARQTRLNGIQTVVSFDAAGRLRKVRHHHRGQDILVTHQVHDARGLVRLRQTAPRPGATDVFEHDALGRLTVAHYGLTAPVPPEIRTQRDADTYAAGLLVANAPEMDRFSLNRADSRRQTESRQGTGVETCAATLNGLQQLVEEACTRNGITTRATFGYDDEGRRTGDGRFRYRYDAAGRLIGVDSADGTVFLLELTWDPAGRLHTAIDTTGRRRFVYSGPTLVQEEDSSGQPLLQWTQVGSADEPVLRLGGSGQAWCHADSLGSVLAVTDDLGDIQERFHFRAFGEASVWEPNGLVRRATSSIGLLPRFAGHLQLAPGLDGLYHMRARIYDALTGRFLSWDPVRDVEGNDTGDPYAYVGHSPVSYLDPAGQERVHQGMMRFGGAVAGALHGFGHMLVESGKTAWDLARAFHAAHDPRWLMSPGERERLGVGQPYEPKMVSAVGRMAQGGMGTFGIVGEMGRAALATPGNALRAAEREDWFEFGNQMLNFYLVGKSAVGVGRGIARSINNRRIGRLDKVSRAQKRAQQLDRLEDQAVKALGERNTSFPKSIHYAARLGKKGRDFGRENRSRVAISERAFTGTVSYVTDLLKLGKMKPLLALRLLLRGNRTLQAVVHETGHVNHPLGVLGVGLRRPLLPGTDPNALVASLSRNPFFKTPRGYFKNPLEFTQPGKPTFGAWDLMLKAPAGPLATGLGAGAVGYNLLDPKGGR